MKTFKELLKESTRKTFLVKISDMHGAQIDTLMDKLEQTIPSFEFEDAIEVFGKKYLYSSDQAFSVDSSDVTKVNAWIKKNSKVDLVKIKG